MTNDLRSASEYVKTEGELIEVDHVGMLADMTGTKPAEWFDADGPETGCGEDYYYVHDVLGLAARINDDQGMLTISVKDEEDDEIASGSIDVSEIR